MTSHETVRLTPCLTPHGRLVIVPQNDAPEIDSLIGERIQKNFERGSGYGLLWLGAAEIGQVLPPAFSYFRDFGNRFVTALCTCSDNDNGQHEIPAPPEDLPMLVLSAPLMPGSEYLNVDVLFHWWTNLGEAFFTELTKAHTSLENFLMSRSGMGESPRL